MEVYDVRELPLASNEFMKGIEEKILKGEELTLKEKIYAGRDHPIKEINGYKLKPNCCYRAIDEKTLKLYKEVGYVIGFNEFDEYAIGNNKGVDWYLGGACLKYGDIVIECPAYKEYFTLANDFGTGMSIDPSVRFIKSSGFKNPIPFDLITNIIDLREEIKKNR